MNPVSVSPASPIRFPFSAVVGAEEVKLALVLSAVDRDVGGVLLRGEKGSAKTTLARGLAALLPGEAPFVELPIGATEDRVVGSLDVAAAFTGGGVRFRSGLLAEADGGVLYVDEVNLLADHLVDALLDVAVSGVNRVEREGVAHTHPARFVIVGSMNPEEGELRPQFLDRFGLAVDVEAPTSATSRAEAVRRRLAYDADPAGFAAVHRPEEDATASRLEAVAAAPPATLPDDLVERVGALCMAVGAAGLRADLVICRAAAALARWEGRGRTTAADIRRVAPLALAHRARRNPLDAHGIDRSDLDRALDDALAGHDAPPGDGADRAGLDPAGPDPAGPDPAGPDPAGPDPAGPDPAGGADGTAQEGVAREEAGAAREGAVREGGAREEAAREGAGAAGVPGGGSAPGGALGAAAAPPVAPSRPMVPVARLETPPRRGKSGPVPDGGRRSVVEGGRGRLIGDRVPAPTGPMSLALGATVREAAARHARDGDAGGLVTPGDLREAVREQRAGNLVILAVDASGSMGARRMDVAKAAVLGLLVDAYQRRDRVCLITFRGEQASVLLRPTASVEVARARLTELPTGGRTPLAAGILAALEVATLPRAVPHPPLLVLVTDGRATAAPAGQDPVAAARAAATQVRRRRVGAVVVDVEEGPVRLGLAAELARIMRAPALTLVELTGGLLVEAVRGSVPPASG